MFIVIDGIDGAGKTTLAFHLKYLLSNYRPIVTKEPTNDSPWALEIRRAATEGRLTKKKELQLFHQDRLHHIETLIKPALDAGQTVICDRYVDSTLAYQASNSVEAELLYEQFAKEIIIPEIIFILDCDVSIGLERLRKRDGDKLTKFETKNTLERASQIFKSRVGENYFHINANGGPQDTLDQAIKILVEKYDFLSDACASYRYCVPDLAFTYAG